MYLSFPISDGNLLPKSSIVLSDGFNPANLNLTLRFVINLSLVIEMKGGLLVLLYVHLGIQVSEGSTRQSVIDT